MNVVPKGLARLPNATSSLNVLANFRSKSSDAKTQIRSFRFYFFAPMGCQLIYSIPATSKYRCIVEEEERSLRSRLEY